MNSYYEYEYYPRCSFCERFIEDCHCSEFSLAEVEGWPNRKTEHYDLLPEDALYMKVEIWTLEPEVRNSENYISLQLNENYVHIVTEKPPDYFVFAMLSQPTFTLFSYRDYKDFVRHVKFKVREK